MMTPLYGGPASKFETAGLDTSVTSGTTITANATPGSDGAWTQLIAATANDWHALRFFTLFGFSTASACILQIAIGGAGSEVVLVDDIPFTIGASTTRQTNLHVWLPLYVPKGSRVAARIHRSTTASTTTRIMLFGETGSTRLIPSFSRSTAYGIVIANARGTVVDPGASANTLGANTEVVASTTNPSRALYIFAMKQDGGLIGADNSSSVELYVGGAGSETVFWPETVSWGDDAAADMCQLCGDIGPLVAGIPSGTRISAKTRSNNATSGERESQVSILALD